MNALNSFENIQMNMQQGFHDLMEHQFQQFSLDEAWKSVTPFDHGRYVMGPGFNPSDTMAFESHQEMVNQMDIMNDMMDQMSTMNDMHDNHHF